MALSIAYFAANGISIPAWNSLIGDLTHDENRGSYFGRRNGLSQLFLFAGIFTGGFILHHFDNLHTPLTGFLIIFLLAAVSRTGSAVSLSRHYDVPYIKREGSQFSFWDFIKRSKKSNFANFVFFIASMSLAIQVAAPFFAIYILRDLGFSYIAYTFQLGVFVASQFIAMRSWGAYADRFGNRNVLKLTGAIMPLIPVLWFFSKEYPYLVLVQVISGLAWGGWALSAGNFIFDAVTPPKRARCAAYFNFFNFTGVFIGAMIGAFLVRIAPSVIDTGAMKIEFISPLQYLFLVSAALRFLVFIVFIPLIREVRPVDAEPTTRETFLLLTHLKPFSGVRHEPFTGRIMKNVKTILDKTHKNKSDK
ncbi:MAG: MFS transporter [bacterium]